MSSIQVNFDTIQWQSGVPFFGPQAVYQGKEVVQLKILSDRRREGGGISWLLKVTPPPGKLIKIVAVAQSDEHIVNLQGGRSTKAGIPARGAGGYGLNTKGQPHSAMTATETIAVVIYTGEPDAVTAVEVIDLAPA